MGMDQHRTADESRDGIEHGAREQCKAPGVVGVVLAAFAVQATARKRAGDVHEHHLGSLARMHFTEEAHFLAAESELDLQGTAQRGKVRCMVAHGAIERQEHHHIRAAAHLAFREAHDGFTESATARKRRVLCREVHDGGLAVGRRANQWGAQARKCHAQPTGGSSGVLSPSMAGA